MTDETSSRGVCGVVDCGRCGVKLAGACAGCRGRDAETRANGTKRCAIIVCSKARRQDSCIHCDDFPCSVFRSPDSLYSHEPGQSGSLKTCNVAALPHSPTHTSAKFVGRLGTYLTVAEHRRRSGSDTVTSEEFASALGIKPQLVRRDFLSLGHFGIPHVGFRLDACIEALRKTLNLKSVRNIIWIGLHDPPRSEQFIDRLNSLGCRVVAILNHGPHSVPARNAVGHIRVLGFGEIERIVKNLGVVGAVIACDGKQAQSAANTLTELGIKSILNLSDVPLDHPPDVFVKNMDFSHDIMLFSFYCGEL